LSRDERNGERFFGSRSLFLTGLADVWGGLKTHARTRTEPSGLALMVVSAAAFSLMAAVAKLWLPHAPTQAVVLSRGVMMTALCVGVALRKRVPLLGKHPTRLLLRGLLGYGALSCYFYSVQHLPLGDAVLLQYSHPVFVASFAPFLLHERTGRGHWPLVLCALAGVALIVGPSGQLRASALVGLTGSLLSGLAYMTIRVLARSEHPLTILVWFPLTTIPGSLAATLLAGRAALPHDGTEVLGHLAVFACALLGQVALTEGLTRVGAARATAVSMLGPVFGVLFGLIFFGTAPTAWSLGGMALVVTSLWLLASRGV
jgi:drug/metabolite transporter (DMT)-like permease